MQERATEQQPRKAATYPGTTSSHDSSIIAVEKPDPFLLTTLLLVFTNIFFGAVVNTVLIVLWVGFLIAIPIMRRKQLQLPSLIDRAVESVVNRVMAYPAELVLVGGLIALVVLQWISGLAPKWMQLALCLQVIAGYTLSRRGSLLLSGYSRPRWALFRRRKQAAAKAAPQAPEPAAVAPSPAPSESDRSAGHDTASMHRMQWEDKQQKRWEEWMQEELDRLNGEYKSDHGG